MDLLPLYWHVVTNYYLMEMCWEYWLIVWCSFIISLKTSRLDNIGAWKCWLVRGMDLCLTSGVLHAWYGWCWWYDCDITKIL